MILQARTLEWGAIAFSKEAFSKSPQISLAPRRGQISILLAIHAITAEAHPSSLQEAGWQSCCLTLSGRSGVCKVKVSHFLPGASPSAGSRRSLPPRPLGLALARRSPHAKRSRPNPLPQAHLSPAADSAFLGKAFLSP